MHKVNNMLQFASCDLQSNENPSFLLEFDENTN